LNKTTTKPSCVVTYVKTLCFQYVNTTGIAHLKKNIAGLPYSLEEFHNVELCIANNVV